MIHEVVHKIFEASCWRDREIETDDDFKSAMLDLAKSIKGY